MTKVNNASNTTHMRGKESSYFPFVSSIANGFLFQFFVNNWYLAVLFNNNTDFVLKTELQDGITENVYLI